MSGPEIERSEVDEAIDRRIHSARSLFWTGWGIVGEQCLHLFTLNKATNSHAADLAQEWLQSVQHSRERGYIWVIPTELAILAVPGLLLLPPTAILHLKKLVIGSVPRYPGS